MARLDELGRGKSRSLQASFRTAADELANQLKRALREVLGEYEKPAGSRRLINALFALKRQDIMEYGQRPDVVLHMMQELISYFCNRLVHDKLVELRDQARVMPPTIDKALETNMTNWAQMALLARYFTENTTPLPDPTEPSGTHPTVEDARELTGRGNRVVRYALFKSNLILPRLSSYFGSPMEKKLTELGILHKSGADERVPAPARWLTRGPAAPLDIEARPWAPGMLPIPYADVGAQITRSRLAAWAQACVT